MKTHASNGPGAFSFSHWAWRGASTLRASSRASTCFSVRQDVQLGKESAEEVDRTYPLLADPQVLRYINDLGGNWLHSAPNNNPAYVWTFRVINSPDINAFALPGGYIYVNRGAIEAAENEAQLAGIIGA